MSNCDNIWKLTNQKVKLWQNLKTLIETKLQLWKISIYEKKKSILNELLVRTIWHLDNWWDVLWPGQNFAILPMFLTQGWRRGWCWRWGFWGGRWSGEGPQLRLPDNYSLLARYMMVGLTVITRLWSHSRMARYMMGVWWSHGNVHDGGLTVMQGTGLWYGSHGKV